MRRDTVDAAPPDWRRRVASRIRRMFDSAMDEGGAAGMCRMCGEQRRDLDGDLFCRRCSMAIW